MGKLIKNHWARLICLTAAACKSLMEDHYQVLPSDVPNADQMAAALEGFFWPKFFFDFLTKNFDGAVKPVPVLQILNLLIGIITFSYEWPIRLVAGTSIHRSMEMRMLWLPLASLVSVLLYQGTNASLYYLVGIVVYFWAYSEGEVSRQPGQFGLYVRC